MLYIFFHVILYKCLQQQQMMFAHLLWNLPLFNSPELIVELSINYSKVKNELSSLLTFKLTWTRSPKRSQNNGEFRDLQFHDKEESRGNTVCWWRPCYTVESSETSELVGLECFVNSCFQEWTVKLKNKTVPCVTVYFYVHVSLIGQLWMTLWLWCSTLFSYIHVLTRSPVHWEVKVSGQLQSRSRSSTLQ